MVDDQVQVTTTRVKGGRKAAIPSSIDPVDKLENIGKETVTKLLTFKPLQTAKSRSCKSLMALQAVQSARNTDTLSSRHITSSLL